MATFQANIPTPANGFTARVEYAYTSDVTNNRSVINSITGKVKRNNSSYVPTNTSKTATLKIERKNDAGTWVTVTTLSNSTSYSITTDNYYTWVSGANILVPHKTDGTQQMRLTFTVDGKLSSYYPLGSVTSTITLADLHTPPLINSYTITEKNKNLVGVPNTTFVNYLSQKKITIDADFYDGATGSLYQVFNGTSFKSSATNKVTIDYYTTTLETFPTDITKIPIQVQVIDSLNGITREPYSFFDADLYTYIPYFKVSIDNSNTILKRQSVTSSVVELTTQGSFYNHTIGSVSQSIDIYYKYWRVGTTEPLGEYGTQIPSENITIVDNTYSVSDYVIGINLDYDKSYNFKMYVYDAFLDTFITKTISVGKPTWTEYKDRVDFEKLTVKGKDISEVVLYNNTTGTATSLTLSETSANFNYLEVFYGIESGSYGYRSEKVYNPNGKKVGMVLSGYASGYIYMTTATGDISGTTITISDDSRIRWATTPGIIIATDINALKIFRVIGYR